MARRVAGLYDRVRHLIPELAKFGVVGGIGAVIDLGGAAVLHGRYHQEPLTAKAVSISIATVVTYIGSRFWTFRHRENQALHRETVLFFALNLVGLIIAEVVIACTTYVLGFKDPIAYNLASLIGTGLGTIFRFFAYRKWVFLAPAAPQAPAVETATYAPWEPMRQQSSSLAWEQEPVMASPYFAPQAQQPREVRLENSVFPNGVVAPHLATATAPPVSSGQGWSTAPSRPAARPANPGPRTPGRHRKTR
ncbi:MAG TPA: GtrA family protein [Trebonia sp.]|jgi:putative flippase GtrA|nr:GtrA family protein [Trebonia sp.]